MVGVVAVYGPRDEVIPPCGKCRQVFHDIDPRIEFVVRGHNGLETRTATELLPHAFDPSHLESAQTIYMWEGYEESIRSGDKTQTIRVDDPFAVGPARIVFEKNPERPRHSMARSAGSGRSGDKSSPKSMRTRTDSPTCASFTRPWTPTTPVWTATTPWTSSISS